MCQSFIPLVQKLKDKTIKNNYTYNNLLMDAQCEKMCQNIMSYAITVHNFCLLIVNKIFKLKLCKFIKYTSS
jgi:hypothetical protein